MSSAKSLTDAILTCMEKTALGFLDLPPEIRLEIYGYLLLAPIGYLRRIHDTPYSRFARVVPLVVCDRTSEDGSTHSRLWTLSTCSLYPAILSTCKTVHGEATAILYGDNTFKVTIHHYSHFDANEWGFRVAEQCKNVFKYDDKNSRRPGGHLVLRRLALFCFLNKIGPRNAARLRAIALQTYRRNVDTNQFQVVANLLERHLLGLKSIVIIGTWHRPRTSPFSVNEEDFKQLCRTLTNLVRGYRSLESLQCLGGDFDSIADLEAKAEYFLELVQLLRARKGNKAPQLKSTQEKEELRF